MRVIACIEDPELIERILRCVERRAEYAERPLAFSPRGPPSSAWQSSVGSESRATGCEGRGLRAAAGWGDFARLEKHAHVDDQQSRFPIRAEFTHDGRYVIVTNARSGTLGVYDAVEPALVREIELEPECDQSLSFFGALAGFFGSSSASVPIGIQSAPGGVWIALANRGRVISMDADTWTATRTIGAGEEPDGMAWSPLTAGDD